MSKITKKQERQIKDVIYHLERARVYLSRADVAVAKKGTPATTSLHYTRADGSTLYEVEKEYGSDLSGLEMGLNFLTNFVRANGSPYQPVNSDHYDNVSDADPGL